MSGDVFGDPGISSVHLAQEDPQGVAVFSNTSFGPSSTEVSFSFLGRKGPPGYMARAPLQVGFFIMCGVWAMGGGGLQAAAQ